MIQRIIFTLIFTIVSTASFASESEWLPVREIVDGLRKVNHTIDSILLSLDESGIQPGVYAEIPADSSLTTQSLKIRFTEPATEYMYLLEIWSLYEGEYQKGIEFSFDDEDSGQFIIRPAMFDNVSFSDEEHYVKAVYNHNLSARTMVVDVIQSAAGKPEKAKYLVSEQGGIISIYFTAHMHDVDIDNNMTDDAYLFGARIEDSDPFTCIAKFGLTDIGGAYGFTLYGNDNPDNAGLFDKDEGFIEDGIAGAGTGYPDPGDITASDLPSAATVGGLTVRFLNVEGPGF